ncbi:aromatic amino acid transport family protein [Neochlamydia sp. AcF95]|uniref:amino acid permease n=1 Tax=Neochlamydia sp. AcF95 TaxID=2795734 RepID=UPI001BCA5BEA|nr:aromatic amino acid transport family protein [Neochlamydia sp. AcF95]MBS4170622.1 Tyrosine-specific transport protein [Neochlamydia sp. AcF95]
MNNTASLLKGALLVAGTSIGGGMLALPVATSLGGFVPSLLTYFFCWVFMACTGLLFLEVSTWMKGEANIVTMAYTTLGSLGKWVAWIIYLFLFYCLNLAYIVGCGNLVSQLLVNIVPAHYGSLLFVLLFSPFVYAGAQVIGHLNIMLMGGLAVFYAAFVMLGAPHVNSQHLFYQDWSLAVVGLPIAFTAFAYQGIIPTLVQYMHNDIRLTRLAILIGSFIPLITYIIWQWLIQGIVPTFGSGGLIETLQKGENAVVPLKHFLGTPAVYIIGQFFAFFALVTSFFGVTLGLLDFLADGLQLKKNSANKLFICLAIFVPPLLISYSHPHIFLEALDYAGGYGCALLLGLLPVLMVWVGRYVRGFKGAYIFPGGRIALVFLFMFVLFEIACESYIKFIK